MQRNTRNSIRPWSLITTQTQNSISKWNLNSVIVVVQRLSLLTTCYLTVQNMIILDWDGDGLTTRTLWRGIGGLLLSWWRWGLFWRRPNVLMTSLPSRRQTDFFFLFSFLAMTSRCVQGPLFWSTLEQYNESESGRIGWSLIHVPPVWCLF